jgi:hypothetical protein
VQTISSKFAAQEECGTGTVPGPRESVKPMLLVAITILALFVCYASTLRGMFDQWMSDEDMGHGGRPHSDFVDHLA